MVTNTLFTMHIKKLNKSIVESITNVLRRVPIKGRQATEEELIICGC